MPPVGWLSALPPHPSLDTWPGSTRLWPICLLTFNWPQVMGRHHLRVPIIQCCPPLFPWCTCVPDVSQDPGIAPAEPASRQPQRLRAVVLSERGLGPAEVRCLLILPLRTEPLQNRCVPSSATPSRLFTWSLPSTFWGPLHPPTTRPFTKSDWLTHKSGQQGALWDEASAFSFPEGVHRGGVWPRSFRWKMLLWAWTVHPVPAPSTQRLQDSPPGAGTPGPESAGWHADSTPKALLWGRPASGCAALLRGYHRGASPTARLQPAGRSCCWVPGPSSQRRTSSSLRTFWRPWSPWRTVPNQIFNARNRQKPNYVSNIKMKSKLILKCQEINYIAKLVWKYLNLNVYWKIWKKITWQRHQFKKLEKYNKILKLKKCIN